MCCPNVLQLWVIPLDAEAMRLEQVDFVSI